MASAVGLVLETVPLAGIVLAGRRERWSDLFFVGYVAAAGLLISALAMAGDHYGLTDWIGVSTEALASF
jgi:hypothetical protein